MQVKISVEGRYPKSYLNPIRDVIGGTFYDESADGKLASLRVEDREVATLEGLHALLTAISVVNTSCTTIRPASDGWIIFVYEE